MGTQPMFWKLAIPFYLFIQTAVGKLFPDGKKFKHPDGQKYIALKETQITTFAPEDLKDFNPKQVRGKEMDSYLDTIKKDLNLETQGEYTILNRSNIRYLDFGGCWQFSKLGVVGELAYNGKPSGSYVPLKDFLEYVEPITSARAAQRRHGRELAKAPKLDPKQGYNGVEVVAPDPKYKFAANDNTYLVGLNGNVPTGSTI